MITRRHCVLSSAASAALLVAGRAHAQPRYPDKPIRIIVALPVGGSVDMIARALGQKLSTSLGQPVIVDNRAGGSGQIGMPAVAKAPADGYTLTVSPASFLTTNRSIFKSLPYDPQKDFTPISLLCNQPTILIVKDKEKYPSVAALLAAAKAAPGKISYASSGDGSPQHLAGLMFESRTKTRLLHVPYRGGALAINDTIGGQVDAMFAVMPEAVPHIRSGKLHPLGVLGPTRSPVFPQVPTMAESGVADLNLSAWIALLGPPGLPRALVDQLGQATRAALDKDLEGKLAESGIEVATSSPDDLQRLIAKELALHAELVKAAGIEPQ